ncbi:CPBP family intramembrane metalloprotease [Dyella sp. LX-66]|uniref:CPBP family intramembrane glutamic endopeptidase n=1 Tax=unclassified Dyella TaxID=2634549 RepID=UPI001BE0DDD8|nr:CPBP family intramembrane metalloprotease [Dyella sp. LX-1]MBT2139940.1 CPBP family intramembrane metalloprotease [Dyella sp. LX-66]
MDLKRYPVALYLVLVVLLSTPYYVLLARSGSMDMGRGFVVHSLMWAPGIAGLLSAWLRHRSVAMLGFGWGRTRYVAAGYLLPILYSLLAYVPLWLSGLAPAAFAEFARDCATRLHWQNAGLLAPALLQIFLTLTFGAIQSAASAAGEEIGWRGYLVPALHEKYGMGATVLLSGLIWAAWHMPVIFFADYHSAAPQAYAVTCFTLMVLITGGIAAWLRLRSGSVWPAIALHAVHNAFIQWLLDPMTDASGNGAWYASEFGAALVVGTGIVAAVLFARSPRPTSPALP